MGDGAHQGVNGETGMRNAMTGDDARQEQERTPEQMRVYLLAAGDDMDLDASFSNACRWAGGVMLRAFQEHPELLAAPMETRYDWDRIKAHPGYAVPAEALDLMRDNVLERSVTDQAEELGYSLKGRGLSGFMVGWAVNAARYALGAPEQPNPALVEVG